MNSHIVLFMQIMQKHSKQRMWSRILAICALTLILTQQKLLTAANKHQLSLMLSYADFAKRIHIACKTDYISAEQTAVGRGRRVRSRAVPVTTT